MEDNPTVLVLTRRIWQWAHADLHRAVSQERRQHLGKNWHFLERILVRFQGHSPLLDREFPTGEGL
jgi:hypothetical protein